MTEESAMIVQGSVASVVVAFLQSAVLRMVPYAIPAFALILLDLIYGVRAARIRGERVRVSTALRRSASKTFSYVVWLILASTLALSFHKAWLEWGVLAFVYANEGASIVGNMLEAKGGTFSIISFWKLIVRKLAGKYGVDISEDEADAVIKEDKDD